MGVALYTAESTARCGRQGQVQSSDGNLDLTLSTPKGLGGKDIEGTTNSEKNRQSTLSHAQSPQRFSVDITGNLFFCTQFSNSYTQSYTHIHSLCSRLDR